MNYKDDKLTKKFERAWNLYKIEAQNEKHFLE